MRLLAAMHHRDGRPIREIAGMPRVPRTAANRRLGRMDRTDRTGLRGRHRTGHRGAGCRLDPDERRQLVLDMRAGPQAPGRGAGVWTLEGEEARQEEVRGGLRPGPRLAPPRRLKLSHTAWPAFVPAPPPGPASAATSLRSHRPGR